MPVHKDWMLVDVKDDLTVGIMKWRLDLVFNFNTQDVVAIAIDSPARSNVRIFVFNVTALFNLTSEWLVLEIFLNLAIEHHLHLPSVTKPKIRALVTNSSPSGITIDKMALVIDSIMVVARVHKIDSRQNKNAKQSVEILLMYVHCRK